MTTVKIRLEPHQAYFVAEKPMMDHMVMLYRTLAEQSEPEHKEFWLEIADGIQAWAEATVYIPEDEDEES